MELAWACDGYDQQALTKAAAFGCKKTFPVMESLLTNFQPNLVGTGTVYARNGHLADQALDYAAIQRAEDLAAAALGNSPRTDHDRRMSPYHSGRTGRPRGRRYRMPATPKKLTSRYQARKFLHAFPAAKTAKRSRGLEKQSSIEQLGNRS